MNFLIAFDSDYHTVDDFPLFISSYDWCFLQLSTWSFLPCVQLQFCELIYIVPRSLIWYYLLHVSQNTLNSDFFPAFFSAWHLEFLYCSSIFAAFGTLYLNYPSEIFPSNMSTYFSFTMHKKFLTSAHYIEYLKWENECVIRNTFQHFMSFVKVWKA